MRLLRNKSLGGFVIRFLIIYGLLMAPWPGLRRAYAAVFRAGGNLVFGSLGPDVRVRFRPPDRSERAADTEIVLTKREGQALATRRVPTKARHLGYTPTAILVALTLSTPSLWRRKWRGLLWGLLAVYGFVALRVGLLLMHTLSEDPALRVFTLGPLAEKLLERAIPALVRAPASSYVAPILIWVLVSFRTSDWDMLPAAQQKQAHKSGGDTEGQTRS